MMPAPTRAARGRRSRSRRRSRPESGGRDNGRSPDRPERVAVSPRSSSVTRSRARAKRAVRSSHVEIHHREVLLERAGGQADADAFGMAAASHAVSSAISAAGRNVASTGHAAAQPRGMASSRKPASWIGFGRYPAKPP